MTGLMRKLKHRHGKAPRCFSVPCFLRSPAGEAEPDAAADATAPAASSAAPTPSSSMDTGSRCSGTSSSMQPRVLLSQGEQSGAQPSDSGCEMSPTSFSSPVPPSPVEAALERLSRKGSLARRGSLIAHCDDPRTLDVSADAQVYAAVDRETRQPVAVKVYNIAELAEQGRLAAVLGELSIHSDLDDERVVRCRRLVQTDSELHIVMELGRGSLQDYMQERGVTLSDSEVMVVAEQLLEGLAYLHASGVVHRDVKPENVVVKVSPPAAGLQLALCDFGWALRFSDAHSHATVGDPAGTVEYAAPEVLDGAFRDGPGTRDTTAGELAKSDIYSLGVLLYCLRFGDSPFAESDPVARRMEMAGGLPQTLLDLQASSPLCAEICAMLAVDVAARPTAAEALARIRGIASCR
eukprot:TRINITY_DN10728_c0_g1_i4.p1 TRINITY_DN10728_c0_g1~~TRINITY_DN10728_c0_g1_i4.p1  ORF type:complete len:408 (+),score=95.82 TRINITY_DN10728_c0_g1_i4:156-1379(+)